ncbi:MAG: type II secretion system F family protein [Pseudomonadota bacterium]
MHFVVRTVNLDSGAIAERLVEGENADLVRHSMERDGSVVLSVAVKSASVRAGGKGAFDTVLFCEELRTLLSSGMSLVEAIETLCSKTNEDSKQGVLQDLRQRLLDGKPLSAALELNPFAFAPLLIASIRASERSSRIESALDEYISYETVGRELGKKMVSAAIYPALVVGFGLLVSMFMISYVVPRFSKVYDDFSQSLSLPTLILMKVGRFSSDYFGAMLGVMAVAAAMTIIAYRNGTLKRLALRILGNFKIARYYLRLYQLARIYQTMSMLLKGGYTVADAIPLAQNLAFQHKLKLQMSLARRAITEGKRLSGAFAENGLTDTVTQRLLQVGERSGNLVKVMDIIAHSHRQEFTLFIERATRLVEPLLLMVVGVMIGAIIVLMYMPVFDLAGGI